MNKNLEKMYNDGREYLEDYANKNKFKHYSITKDDTHDFYGMALTVYADEEKTINTGTTIYIDTNNLFTKEKEKELIKTLEKPIIIYADYRDELDAETLKKCTNTSKKKKNIPPCSTSGSC